MTKDKALKKVLDIAERYLLDEDFLPIKEALAQPEQEQEPVAWMSPDKRSRIEFARKDTVYGSHTIPLYTKEQ